MEGKVNTKQRFEIMKDIGENDAMCLHEELAILLWIGNNSGQTIDSLVKEFQSEFNDVEKKVQTLIDQEFVDFERKGNGALVITRWGLALVESARGGIGPILNGEKEF